MQLMGRAGKVMLALVVYGFMATGAHAIPMPDGGGGDQPAPQPGPVITITVDVVPTPAPSPAEPAPVVDSTKVFANGGQVHGGQHSGPAPRFKGNLFSAFKAYLAKREEAPIRAEATVETGLQAACPGPVLQPASAHMHEQVCIVEELY